MLAGKFWVQRDTPATDQQTGQAQEGSRSEYLFFLCQVHEPQLLIPTNILDSLDGAFFMCSVGLFWLHVTDLSQARDRNLSAQTPRQLQILRLSFFRTFHMKGIKTFLQRLEGKRKRNIEIFHEIRLPFPRWLSSNQLTSTQLLYRDISCNL